MPGRSETVAALESVDQVDTGLDVVINLLAEHPRITCALICAAVVLAFALETPR